MQALEDAQFRGFVQARGHALLRTAYLLTGDQQLAEDLVQTALEKAVRHWRDIRVAAAAEAYVRQTMYREQVSFWRRRRAPELLTSEIPEPRVAQSSEHVRIEDREMLRAALMALGTRQRTVLVLRFFEDLTEQEVARVMGISVGTVKSQAAKALEQLRRAHPELLSPARIAPREAL